MHVLMRLIVRHTEYEAIRQAVYISDVFKVELVVDRTIILGHTIVGDKDFVGIERERSNNFFLGELTDRQDIFRSLDTSLNNDLVIHLVKESIELR